MNELSGTTVMEGWWCIKCEYVENDDASDTEGQQCMACGCDGSDHVRVDVVAR